MSLPEFRPFSKIARISRNCVITEKIDGTNGQLYVNEDGVLEGVGSRNRWITPEQDNFGFARWAWDHAQDLAQLGPAGWGLGIQRRYGLEERRFSLFNTSRWGQAESILPDCCSCVPILYEGIYTTEAVEFELDELLYSGSRAAPGFMKPEGIVVWHVAARVYMKKTIEKDEVPKFVQAQKT